MKDIYCYLLSPINQIRLYECKFYEYKNGTTYWKTRDGALWKSLFDCGVGFLYNGYSHLLVMNNNTVRVRCIECNLDQQNEFRKHYKYSTEIIDINTQEKLKEMILNFFQYKYATSGITIDNIKLAINPLGI